MRADHMCALVVLIMCVTSAHAGEDGMKYFSRGFAKVLKECKHELNMTERVIMDLFHFIRQEYEQLDRSTGCFIVCMSEKLALIDDDGNMHHGNAHEFALSHGADQEMAKKLVSWLHDCEKKSAGIEDYCLRILEIAKCFRSAIRELDWNPQFIVEEILTEI